jgi:hypothetical protein
VYIATWNFADDQRGLDRSAKQLKAQAFPYDNLDCEPLIQELLRAGCLVEYESGGKKYLHISKFRKHQKVEKPALPKYPVYEESMRTQVGLTDASPSPHLGVAVSSLEGKGSKNKSQNARARVNGSPPVDNSAERALAPNVDKKLDRKAETRKLIETLAAKAKP